MTREEAIKILKTERYCQEDTPNLKRVRKAYDMAIEALQSDAVQHIESNTKESDLVYRPSADVVEVVRCKDCKWSDWYETLNGEHRCYCMEHGSSGHTDDDYCSYGEREESEAGK